MTNQLGRGRGRRKNEGTHDNEHLSSREEEMRQRRDERNAKREEEGGGRLTTTAPTFNVISAGARPPLSSWDVRSGEVTRSFSSRLEKEKKETRVSGRCESASDSNTSSSPRDVLSSVAVRLSRERLQSREIR